MPGRFRKRRDERRGAARAEGDDATVEELAAAANELSTALGRAPVEDARLAAIERLTEMRAAGTISAETFERERQRLLHYG